MPPWRVISTRLSGPIARALSLAGAGDPVGYDQRWAMARCLPSAPLEEERFIGIETVESPSWVAWREMSILGN